MNTTIPWRTFSIFISSTFADMQAERDHLRNHVFPKVEEELQNRRIKLEIVDLRWGVDTTSIKQEEEREANVLKVCLDEIRRCRPFFIGLLGDRYGWVPPLERMETAMSGEVNIKPEKGKSVTDLEIEFGVLASQEQLVRSVFYFREPLLYTTFSKKKAAMFSDEHNPELSHIEKAERKTALEKLKKNIQTHFDDKNLKDKVKTYTATWDAEKEKVTGLETWGDQVYRDILDECENHARETWNQVPQNWQEQELALLDSFIETHTHVSTFITEKGEERVPTFCGRKPLLEELKKHLLSDDARQWGLVLTGESGSGKSAVFSMVHKMMETENCLILAHSAGLSPRAKKVADLLNIWNNLLRKHLGMKQEMEDTSTHHLSPEDEVTGVRPFSPEWPGQRSETPIEQLQQQFAGLLGMAAAKQRVVLLVDALDRFEPTGRARAMSWLPIQIPANVHMMVTAITGTEKEAVKYHRGLQTKSIDSFSQQEAEEMLVTLGRRHHKSLSPGVAKLILEKNTPSGLPASSSPLWLSLAVNMLMAIDQDDFEQISKMEGSGGQQIESYLSRLAQGFDALPGKLFLSLLDKAGMLFGREFTRAVFDYIAVSRNGLREKDLEHLLPASGVSWDALQFANLRRWFKAHLVMQGEELQWNLVHSILRNALMQNAEETRSIILHGAIAEYLIPLHNDPLKATETLYHLISAGKNSDAAFYYGSNLTEEEVAGATTVLTETATMDASGLELVSNLPGLVLNEFAVFHRVLQRYIYDLNDSLKIEGKLAEKLEILEKLKEKVEENFRKFFTDEIFGYNVGALYMKLGSLYKSMGHLAKALKYFEIDLALSQELYDANPNSEELKNSLAISYEKLGSIQQSLGNMEEALKYFKLRYNYSKELYDANPKSEELKNELAIAYFKFGSIHQSMGNMEEALKYFELRYNYSKELYDANPKSEELKNEHAISCERLGSIIQFIGYKEEIHLYFEESNSLMKELYEANPLSESFKNNFAISLLKLGEIYHSMGHLEKAVVNYENYNRLKKELFEANPLNESLKNGLAISYSKLGDIHQSMGHLEEALKYFEKRSILGKELYLDNPHNVGLLEGMVISYFKLAMLYKAVANGGDRYIIELCKTTLNKFLENDHKVNLYSGVKHLNDESQNRYIENYRSIALFNSSLGFIMRNNGDIKDAIDHFGWSIQNWKLFAENFTHGLEKQDNQMLREVYGNRADLLHQIGRFDEAIVDYTEMATLAEILGEVNWILAPIQNIAIIHLKQNNFEKALLNAEKLELMARDNQEVMLYLQSIAIIITCHINLRNKDKALIKLQQLNNINQIYKVEQLDYDILAFNQLISEMQ